MSRGGRFKSKNAAGQLSHARDSKGRWSRGLSKSQRKSVRKRVNRDTGVRAQFKSFTRNGDRRLLKHSLAGGPGLALYRHKLRKQYGAEIRANNARPPAGTKRKAKKARR